MNANVNNYTTPAYEQQLDQFSRTRTFCECEVKNNNTNNQRTRRLEQSASKIKRFVHRCNRLINTVCNVTGLQTSSGSALVSLNRLSVGCGTTPRRQSGDICRLLFGIRVIYKMLPPHGHCRNIFFYKQLKICISIYFGLI